MSNIEGRLYTVREVAEFFDRTQAWAYWCLKNNKFAYENGEEIQPSYQTPKGSKKAYDLDDIHEMALSLYRFNSLTDEELRKVMGKIITEREKLLESEGESA